MCPASYSRHLKKVPGGYNILCPRIGWGYKIRPALKGAQSCVSHLQAPLKSARRALILCICLLANRLRQNENGLIWVWALMAFCLSKCCGWILPLDSIRDRHAVSVILKEPSDTLKRSAFPCLNWTGYMEVDY